MIASYFGYNIRYWFITHNDCFIFWLHHSTPITVLIKQAIYSVKLWGHYLTPHCSCKPSKSEMFQQQQFFFQKRDSAESCNNAEISAYKMVHANLWVDSTSHCMDILFLKTQGSCWFITHNDWLITGYTTKLWKLCWKSKQFTLWSSEDTTWPHTAPRSGYHWL